MDSFYPGHSRIMEEMQELNIEDPEVSSHFIVGKYYKMDLQPKDVYDSGDSEVNQEDQTYAELVAKILNKNPHQVDYIDTTAEENELSFRPLDTNIDTNNIDESLLVRVPNFKFIKFMEVPPPLAGGRTRKSKKSRHTQKAKTSKKARKTKKGKTSKKARKSRRHH
jgi:hypothetical protein